MNMKLLVVVTPPSIYHNMIHIFSKHGNCLLVVNLLPFNSGFPYWSNMIWILDLFDMNTAIAYYHSMKYIIQYNMKLKWHWTIQ